MSLSDAVPLSAAHPRRHLCILAAFGFFMLLTCVAHRGGVRLSFDSYYYVEYAKEFRRHVPDSFGQSWPFGWPLLGATGGLVGLSAYHTLLACAVLSVLVLLHLAAGLLPWADLGGTGGLLVLSAGVGTYSLAAMLAGVFSELPFAAVLLAMAFSLSRWPRPTALLSSALLALAALALRYAGGLAFVLLAVWLVADLRRLREAGKLPLALACAGGASLVAASLLWWNHTVTGGFSGGMPRGDVPFGTWPGIVSDLGWSLPAMCGGHVARMLLGFWSPLRLPLGWLLFALLFFLGLAAWRRAGSRESRALAALLLVYLTGLVMLRWRHQFDDLHNARMLFPVFIPLLVVAAGLPVLRRYLPAGCALMLALNTALCLRGASLEIAADVRPAVPLVAAVRWPASIMVNDAAFTLSALVDAPVNRLDVATLLSPQPPAWPTDYIVLAAPSVDRSGRTGPMDPEAVRLIASLLASGRYTALLRSPELVVLGRVI